MTLTYHRTGRQVRGAGKAAAPTYGGNTLGHRPDCVPGTTLFTPASMCVQPALHTKLTERDPKAPLPHRHAALPVNDGFATSYAAAHRFPEGVDYSVDPRVRRPAAVTERSVQPPSQEAPRFGESTYRMELLQRSNADINGGGRGSGSSASAPTSPANRPGIAAARPGYLTTNAAATTLVAERYASSKYANAASPANKPRSAGSSPSAPGAGAGSRCSSAQGSAVCQAAGCFRNPPPVLCSAAGIAVAGRVGAGQQVSKDAAYLHALDQHSRGRLPGYTGHRPQHNVALELPPPSKLTTWGADSQAALRSKPVPSDASHGIKSSLLGFFAAGSAGASQGFVSENGLAEAARFHETTRPLEGRMRIPQASQTTRRGAPFTG